MPRGGNKVPWLVCGHPGGPLLVLLAARSRVRTPRGVASAVGECGEGAADLVTAGEGEGSGALGQKVAVDRLEVFEGHQASLVTRPAHHGSSAIIAALPASSSGIRVTG